MQVAVPAGARAGSSFQVQLASSIEATSGELETALKNAQSTAALACTLIKGAAKVTIFTAKVTYAGAKYAHAHGWDKKAASMCASAVSMGGSAMSSMMTSKTGKAAMTMAVGGGAWNAATDYAAGETIANSTPVPGLKQKFPDNPGVAPPTGSSGEQLLYVMVPPPLYRDGRYNMNQTVINSIFPGGGAAGIRAIARALSLPVSHVLDVYSLFQQHCPVVGGTPGNAPNATDVPCDWIGWCSGVNSTACLGIDGCHPNDVGYGQIAGLVHAAVTKPAQQHRHA